MRSPHTALWAVCRDLKTVARCVTVVTNVTGRNVTADRQKVCHQVVQIRFLAPSSVIALTVTPINSL